MQLVEGLPHGVVVGQTQIQHPSVQAAKHEGLTGFNLALHVNDQPQRVQHHRMQLLKDFAQYGVKQLTWMNQTHSTISHYLAADDLCLEAQEGDGLVTQNTGHALMMMTADCLPVVLVNADGTEIANLHAGWRGLANGIIENTINMMRTVPTWAWLGAAISQPCFEVGAEVKQIFCEKYPVLESAFADGKTEGKYQADLYAIARHILQQHGVQQILGGDQCSYTQAEDYFSYRRNSQTGRMATFVFIQEK